jgi:PAS domain S-box-containing protein
VSAIDNPQPESPTAPARPAGERLSASLDNLDKRDAIQDTRDEAQDAREAEQNLRETGQNLREARMALVESEEWFRLLVEGVTDYAIYMLDPLGKVVTWNVGAERSKGYKAEEILGRNYSIFFLPEEVEAGVPARELAEATRVGRFETEAWRQRKDGSRFWALVTLTAIRDSQGELCGFAKVTRDMSERKNAEEALRRHNAELERYRLIVENISDYVIITLDAEGRIDSWTSVAANMAGYSAEEAVGKEYALVFTAEDAASGQPRREMEEAARTGRCASESWRQRRDGTKFWASGVLTAIRDQTGKLTGYIRVARDITPQKRAEEALRSLNAQLQRYRIIVENISDYVIYTLDAEGRIDSWSHGLEELLGFTAEEAVGKEYALVFTAEEIELGQPRREMEEAARAGRCASDSWRVRRDGTTFWSSGVLTAIHDDAGKLTGYIRVARNMTLQKQLEESLKGNATELARQVAERTRELEANLAELQRKNQEVEAFVYIVSHDLRAPLVNVQGFVRELEQSCKHLKEVIQTCPRWEQCWPGIHPILEEEIGGALHYISASATKFERLIDALLGFSRHGRQVYKIARVNVWELVTNTVTTFDQAITEAGAEIGIGRLPAVTADATALGQVFSNLIGNALKYRSPERPLKIEIGGQVEDGMVHYWVRDNGLGIPELAQAKLFQVFQRFHAQQAEGEGMGLAIAHRIVERHGGKIWAESREGEGTAFHFSLPCDSVAAQQVA